MAENRTEFVVWVCPVCKNLSAYGKADDLEGQRRARPHCYGSDAPGYPGGHDPTPMEGVEVARVERRNRLEAAAERLGGYGPENIDQFMRGDFSCAAPEDVPYLREALDG